MHNLRLQFFLVTTASKYNFRESDGPLFTGLDAECRFALLRDRGGTRETETLRQLRRFELGGVLYRLISLYRLQLFFVTPKAMIYFCMNKTSTEKKKKIHVNDGNEALQYNAAV